MLLAKPIIDEKFWIIERNGEKVGTLRKTKDLVPTINQKNFKFTDIKSLCDSTEIKFVNRNKRAAEVFIGVQRSSSSSSSSSFFLLIKKNFFQIIIIYLEQQNP